MAKRKRDEAAIELELERVREQQRHLQAEKESLRLQREALEVAIERQIREQKPLSNNHWDNLVCLTAERYFEEEAPSPEKEKAPSPEKEGLPRIPELSLPASIGFARHIRSSQWKGIDEEDRMQKIAQLCEEWTPRDIEWTAYYKSLAAKKKDLSLLFLLEMSYKTWSGMELGENFLIAAHRLANGRRPVLRDVVKRCPESNSSHVRFSGGRDVANKVFQKDTTLFSFLKTSQAWEREAPVVILSAPRDPGESIIRIVLGYQSWLRLAKGRSLRLSDTSEMAYTDFSPDIDFAREIVAGLVDQRWRGNDESAYQSLHFRVFAPGCDVELRFAIGINELRSFGRLALSA